MTINEENESITVESVPGRTCTNCEWVQLATTGLVCGLWIVPVDDSDARECQEFRRQ